MSFPRACLFFGFLAAGAGAALAQTGAGDGSGDLVMIAPTPREPVKGARPSRLSVLSPADHDIYLRAFDAGTHGDWTTARSLARQGGSEVARRLLEWRYALDANSGASFAEIDAVLKDTDSASAKGVWPLRGTLYARAEQALPDDPATIGMTAESLAAWFGKRAPATSIGKIRLGEALLASAPSEAARAHKLIRAGWAEGSFDTATELGIIQRDGAWLTPEADRARLDNLLWRGQTAAARRQMARVDDRTQALAEARIALMDGLSSAKAALAKVGDSDDPALLMDWSQALRRAGKDDEAHAMLLRVSAEALVPDHAAAWWNESAIQARDALDAGDPRTAYRLVEHAGLTEGVSYAEQEFLAGFIALRFLKDPAAALTHFRRLNAGVSRPISKARAYYWLGRAYEAEGQTKTALARYREAASFPDIFYGQLALAHIDPTPMLRLADTPVEAAPQSQIDADPLMPEIRVLADLGQAATLRGFLTRDTESFPAPAHQKRLMMDLTDWGYPELALRLAKGLSYDGTNLYGFSHPTVALPPYPGPGAAPEPALVLGLIRQETEFNPYAISGAGARGLMQMMPASARMAAKRAGLSYRPEAMLTDTAYNMKLGMVEYAGHLERFDGSLVLAACSYNAGPGNTRKWLAAMGDPRQPGVDPVDWIEQIPFGETRNYVQRVLENLEVYRARLAGGTAKLRILEDLYAPRTPPSDVLK
jgi:soluble lytic murein transglycosylase